MVGGLALLKKLIEETKDMSQEEFDRRDRECGYNFLYKDGLINPKLYDGDDVVFGILEIDDED